MRMEIAYLIIMLLVVGIAAVVWQTRRYLRSEARRLRGHRRNPVRRPFWMP